MSNTPEFITPISFTPPAPREPVYDEVVYDLSHLPPLPPMQPIEFPEPRRFARSRTALAMGGALVAVACLSAGLNEALPDVPPTPKAEDYCPSDPVPRNDETLETIRHKVANMSMGITSKQSEILKQKISEAQDSDAIEVIMNSHLEQFNLTYHTNQLPDLDYRGLPIPDSLSGASYFPAVIRLQRDDASRLLNELSLVPRAVLSGHELPVDIYSVRGYQDRIHSLGEGWAEPLSGDRSTMVIDGGHANMVPKLLLTLAGKECGFKVGQEGYGALIKTDQTQADAWLRGREPNIDALREYQEYMGGIAFIRLWASLGNVTMECRMTDLPTDKFTVAIGQGDGANRNQVEMWRVETKATGEPFPQFTWVYGYVSGGPGRDQKFQRMVESRTIAEYGFVFDGSVNAFSYSPKQAGTSKVMCQGFSFE